ncbi:MAG TPA: SUMF1/EgtB/PvdO family nonheme iron enzyme [Terriglobia bacterium]|nr:SUMF1/EgtB/PvdO family nonheme iron enzyme [Terriglobia bacterium]
MERRNFLKSSLLGAGTLMTGLGLEKGNVDALQDPAAFDQGPASINGWVKVPGQSYEVTDALTKVPVTITIGEFLIASKELTQREFEEVMGYNPSFHRGADLPVETVTWWEAIRYCNLRSLRENLEPCYDLETGFCDVSKKGFRLPTDDEWTHAAGPVPPMKSNAHAANLGTSDTKDVTRLVEGLKDKGTRPVGSYPPNSLGLYDMFGNVWEWTTDYFNPELTPQRSYNPAGPWRGLARIVRGGSFISTTSEWARGYRSSIEPSYKSRFTGFRMCRTVGTRPALPSSHKLPDWFKPYNKPPAGYETSIGTLSSLVAGVSSLAEWNTRREGIQSKWLRLLGSMETDPPFPQTRVVETVRDQNYTARLMYLQVEADWWEKILLMMPAGDIQRPRPVVIVPFYDVDTPAGRNLSGHHFLGMGVDSYAYMAVQKGYIAVAIRWFGESYGEWYSEAVANLKLRHPHCTGLGKWVWDSHRLLDYLYTLPEVDRARIGMIGHSLGGKMALYAAAFEPRITAVVSNELGIGLSFSNYDDYWYFGKFIDKVDNGTDQHELIGLIAPRPFLLIGGDTYDTAKSWYYINAARQVYQLYRKPENIGYFNHHKGHMPTPEAVWRAMEWLAHFLGPCC